MIKIRHNKEIGIEGENQFIKKLNENGIPYTYEDGLYDFEIYGQKVDVKTCRLTHKFSNKKIKNQCYKIGRFQLTKNQRNNKLWYAMFVRHGHEYLFMGFYEIKNPPKYISIHQLREYQYYPLNEFIKIAKKRQK